MRRADRLFALVQLIRGRRLSTAVWLAGRLEVSLRTVYRDLADLQAQGVPIEGEAGVGYRLGKGFDLPPLMFTTLEARALALATRLAQQWLDPAMALAATDAMSRVLSVLPPGVRAEAESQQQLLAPVGLEPELGRRLQLLREAAQARQDPGRSAAPRNWAQRLGLKPADTGLRPGRPRCPWTAFPVRPAARSA